MENILTEIYRGIKEKVGSPFGRYFLISWIITNYRFLYILFFQDDALFLEKHKELKIDYLTNHSFYGNIRCNIFLFLIFPMLSALFFLYLFPRINRYFLNIYMKNKHLDEKAKQEYKIKEIKREIARNKVRKENEQEKLEVQQKEIEVQKNEKEIKKANDKDRYKREYEKLKNNKYFKSFGKIIEYCNLQKPFKKRDRRMTDYYILDENILNTYISLDIISITESNNPTTGPYDSITGNMYINLTEKGKRLSQLYFEDNNKYPLLLHHSL